MLTAILIISTIVVILIALGAVYFTLGKDALFKVIKIISKILSWALFVILLIAAVFLIYYYIATKIYAAKGAGHEPKFSIYTIISPSMTPNINVYDAVINARVDNPEDIEVGDVITFISTSLLTPGTTITHRVVAITTDSDGKVCYTTKGDYNPVEDQACAKFSNVLGKVIFKIPQLGRVQFFLASRFGWLICILIPACYIIIRDILRILKLTDIKNTASKMDNKHKKDPKREKEEALRKMELKRKLLKEEKINEEDEDYYKDPEVREVKGNKKRDISD